jgi:hypothetical protein
MSTSLAVPSEFDFRVRPENLLPQWRIVRDQFKGKPEWYYLSKLAAYASARGRDASTCDEALLKQFGEAFGAAGSADIDRKLETIRREIGKLRASQPNGPWPTINPSRRRIHARQAQRQTCTQVLLDDIEAYLSACMPNVKEGAKNARRNFLLRMIATAEAALGAGCIARLVDLFRADVLRALKARAWGAGAVEETPSAVHNRCRLLEIGIAYFFDVEKSEQEAGRLHRLLQKGPRRGNEVKPKMIGALQGLDQASLKAIGARSRQAVADFAAHDGGPGVLEHAQCGVGLILVLGAALRTGDVAKVEFDGEPRKIPGAIALERKTLCLPGPTKPNLEENFSDETVAAIDAYWIEFWRRTGKPPLRLLAHRNGDPKSSCSFAVAVGKFGAAIGLKLTPQLLRLAVVRALYATGASHDDVAATLGVKQLINVKSRFDGFSDEAARAKTSERVVSDEEEQEQHAEQSEGNDQAKGHEPEEGDK